MKDQYIKYSPISQKDINSLNINSMPYIRVHQDIKQVFEGVRYGVSPKVYLSVKNL